MPLHQPWTEQEDTTLRTMYADGCSARQIGYEVHRTRNAVIGRWERLGLNGSSLKDMRHTSERQMNGRRDKGMAEKKRRRGASKMLWKGPPEDRQDPHVPLPDVVAEPRHLTLMELSEEDCHWPYGDKTFTFCGCRKQDGAPQPYCEAHMTMSMSPPRYR
jgi:GcrA cell cycle regulator